MTTLQSAMVKVLENKTVENTCMDGDEFLSLDDLVPIQRDAVERSLKRALAEVEELFAEKRWEDIVALFHPVEEKQPELIKQGLDAELRAKSAFALGQLNRFDDAIKELIQCIKSDPNNFLYHSSLGYTAYNSLFAANNREIFLRGNVRRERIDMAHKHLKKAQELRPEGIANFYREGMLFRKLERKTEKALPLFERAVFNWDKLDEKEKQARHRERKNFVKSLYQLAAATLETGLPQKSLKTIKRCLQEDEKSDYMSLVFKYFALGKVHFQLNNFGEARDALLFAIQCRTRENIDFVHELLARTYLAQGNAQPALEAVNRVPVKARRPYYRWTEADVLCALKEFDQAKEVLLKTRERDNRSRHKALIRLARISYITSDFSDVVKYAAEADAFFQEKWGNRFYQGLFWQALGAYRAGDRETAVSAAMELKAHNPRYPKLDVLLSKLETAKGELE